MANTPDNTVKVDVLKVKGKPFYAVVGPGGVVLAANPMMDGATGEKDMTQQEVYQEFEKLLMQDEHIKNPGHYEIVNQYLAPDNMEMLAALDMRRKTLDESKDIIIKSTSL